MERRQINWLHLVLAAVLVATASGVWLKRGQVEALANAAFGVADTDRSAGGRGGRRGREARPVIVAPVTKGRDDVAVEAIGTARARQSVTLYSSLAGEIIQLSVKSGQKVEKGAPLVALEARKAELAVKMARSKLLDAKRKLSRADQLRRRNVNSLAAVDDAQTVYERAQIELDQAEEALDDLVVQAPFAGIVGIPKVEVGDRVTPGSSLLTLDDRAVLIVEFSVAERYLPRVHVGDSVMARTPGFPRETFTGQIAAVDSRVDPTARTVTVRATLPNEADKLRPGMSFIIALNLPGKSYPKVPDLALQFSQDGNFVWLVEAGKARKRPVTLVRRLDGSVLVDGPLTVGDEVVVEGVQRLRDGIAIRRGDAVPGRKKPSNRKQAMK